MKYTQVICTCTINAHVCGAGHRQLNVETQQ